MEFPSKNHGFVAMRCNLGKNNMVSLRQGAIFYGKFLKKYGFVETRCNILA